MEKEKKQGPEEYDPDWWEEPPRETPMATRSTRGYPRLRGAPAGERRMPRLEAVPGTERPPPKKPGQWLREERARSGKGNRRSPPSRLNRREGRLDIRIGPVARGAALDLALRGKSDGPVRPRVPSLLGRDKKRVCQRSWAPRHGMNYV